MKWFKRKNKKSRSQDLENTRSSPQHATPPVSSQTLAKLPDPILERIFAFVCPHARDETYESCEDSAAEDTCMLCDLRDLSHCAQVSRKWRAAAVKVLYYSIRIDAVHYCDLEDVLAEKRKCRSFMRHNAEPEDTAAARLKFLARTLHDNKGGFALNVRYLKTPYMTRETCKPDLARIVACCPSLRYVDLPEGVFQDDPSCTTIKQEVQGRCPELRKMTYVRGAERGLKMLASGHQWHNLEVLELGKLNVDPTILRQALGSLPNLHALKVTDMISFHDQLFQHSDYLPPFPALDEMIFENIPNLTADGLVSYLLRPDTQNTLKVLSLTSTGIHPPDLQRILAVAPKLEHLSITESVTSSFPAADIPTLQSKSLKTFHYEITSADSANMYANTTASHYAYLTRSLLSGGLPSLKELYVRDHDFPETLLDLAPPLPGFATDPDNFRPPMPPNPFAAHNPNQNRLSSNNPFAKMQAGPGLKQELQVFSKGLDEMEWNFSKVLPAARGRRGSATAPRPVSSYGLSDSMGKGWQSASGGARKSVIVGNGFGGFLAVPSNSGDRPSSSAGERRRGSQYDMWR
ncbi:related to F-box domain protein [Rhynchosporium secalis]|uniref:Related to F-box domain protein n=1 Tax=Rhynchosporium secalis TaxID=38038 RepID=A0A1E1MPZ4_RHYSE|nr:related to F-box domain protein [Rhynchosporium secalis]